MRSKIALIATSLLVGATVAAAPAANAASTTPEIPAVPAASSTLPCPVQMSIIGAGKYREITVEDTTSPRAILEVGEVPGGRSIRSLGTGFYHDDFGFRWRDNYGNTSSSLFRLSTRTNYETGEHNIDVTSLARGWGGFRRLVSTGLGNTSVGPDTLYGLHDNGSLYRYRISYVNERFTATGAGSVAGFSDLKTIALISVTSSYHALLANTTGGQLVVIKIPTSSTMTATRTVIRSRTWQGFEHLALTDCGDGWNQALIGIDHDTSSAYAYSMEDLRNTSSSIVGHGQVAGSWPWLVLNSLYYEDYRPQGA